ncbi:MAG: NAD(P)/FAD-dependent oxidoreductase [Chitinophagales bacterium]
MHIVIIGNGISGITTARYVRKMSDHKITVISAETKHFFSRTALMYIYMGHMKYENTKPYEDFFWEKNRINLVHDYVENIDFSTKKLAMQKGEAIKYDKLVLAVGSKSNKFGWPGQDLNGVQGLYNMQDLEKLEKNTPETERAVIVGGGLIGIELAEMLLSRRIKVTMLVREGSYWNNVLPKEESEMINRHIAEHHVDLRLSSELKEILPDENGRVRAILTKSGEEIKCQIVGLTAGVSPNIGFLKNTELATRRGIYINHYLETNITDVYAIGDCAEFSEPLPNRRPIEQVWYTGRMQGITLAHTLTGKRKLYQPRIWFNSAKFFDIEYQTYGIVMPKLRAGEKQLYWEHESGKKCVKIVYDEATKQLVGINTFGIRFRHDVCETWLAEKRDLAYVMQHLRAAHFDPEFYDRYEKDILAVYHKDFPNEKVVMKSEKSLWNMIFAK